MAVRSDALFYEALIREICEKAGITPVAQTPGGVEAVLRVGRDEKKEFLFLLNLFFHHLIFSKPRLKLLRVFHLHIQANPLLF